MPLNIGTSKVSKLYLGSAEIKKAYLGDIVVFSSSSSSSSGKIYGATWDGTSTTKWIRTDDAADFADPNPYVAGATTYGSPFDDIMPWAGMTIEERTGGTMVKIPKFWYQLYQNTEGTPSSGMTIRIANEPLEGFSVSPAHMDRGDGKGERDFVYVGRYHCASDFKSKAEEYPITGFTRDTARTRIHALGNNIWQLDFATYFTIWLLYLVEFANWNSQECIGYGCGTGNSFEKAGYTNSMTYYTGTTQTDRTTYGFGTQYRYLEGLWDNCICLIDGCYNNTDGLNIILNPSKFSDSNNGKLVGYPFGTNTPGKFTVTNSGGFSIFYSSGGNQNSPNDRWKFYKDYPCITGGGGYSLSRRSGICSIGCLKSTTTNIYTGCRLMELS